MVSSQSSQRVEKVNLPMAWFLRKEFYCDNKILLMSINLLKVKYVNDLTLLFTKMHQLIKVIRSMKYTYARECTLTLM